jgi:hypothetical protein
MTRTIVGYRDRTPGPHRQAELLCPSCRGLLAVGWRADREAELELGPILPCELCHRIVLVGDALEPGSTTPTAQAVWPVPTC